MRDSWHVAVAEYHRTYLPTSASGRLSSRQDPWEWA